MTSDLLLSQALEGFYLARRADGYSPGTITQYQWALSRWLQFMGDKKIFEISADDARKFIVYLQTDYQSGQLSPVSIFHAWKAIRAFYKWLFEVLQVENVMLVIKRPSFQYKLITPFSNDEVEKLLKIAVKVDHQDEHRRYTRRTPQGVRNRLIILFLLDTGLRIGEFTRLNVEDVNLETCEVTVRPFRSSRKSKPRIVYIGKRLQKELWRFLLNKSANDPLVTSTNDRRLTADAIQHLLARIGKRAGVKNVHPHVFRHTFAIQFLRNGGNIFTLQRLLGHSTLIMVQKYLALAQSDIENAHRQASPVDNWRF